MAGGEKNLWIIANWKSNKTISEALEWVSQVGPRLERKDNIKVIVCPEVVALEEVKKAVMTGGFPLIVGAQDLSPFDQGAYTGEEAAPTLKGIVQLSILGHSERKQNFGETDQMVSLKVKEAKDNGIVPLVCVQNEQTPVPDGCKLIAYEPPFSISTSGPDAQADTPEDAEKVARVFKEKYGEDLEVLYGGSVTAQNAKTFLSQENISGVLVGGASLDPEEFLKIVESSYV